MIVELLCVLAMLVGGCALLRTGGLTGWGLPALGYLAGVALFVTIGLLQLVTPVTSHPALTAILTAALPVGWWLFRLLRGRGGAVPVLPAAGVLVGVAAAVLLFRWSNLVNYHYDSFRYLMNSVMIANDTFVAGASPNLFTKRMVGVPVLHAPAQLSGEFLLWSVFPLLAIATAASLTWFFVRGVRGQVDQTRLVLFAVLGTALLVSVNRFVFNGFYVNGHLLFAAMALTIAACGWLLATRDDVPVAALVTLQLIALPTAVVTRVEASFLLVLALLPTLLSSRIADRYRAAALTTLGGSVLVWQLFQVFMFRERDSSLPIAVTGELLLGAALIAAVPLVRWRLLTRRSLWFLGAAEAALWLALAAFTVREPDVLIDSLRATVKNVALGYGAWGWSLVVLSLIGLGALILLRAPGLHYLRFPVTTFIPLAYLFAYLREGAYRVGNFDSLNRMLIQVVPLAVLFLVVAMVHGRWRFGRRDPDEPAPEAAESRADTRQPVD